DGEFQRVAGGGFLEGQPHLLVDVGGQLGDVRGIEPAPDRVLLPVDLDGHHTGSLVHYPFEGLRPSNSPTRSLASRSAGSLRSRGSLRSARSRLRARALASP